MVCALGFWALTINLFLLIKTKFAMKKYFLVLVVFFISIILIFSCRKSIEPQPNPDQKLKPANDTEMKIQEFLNRMQSTLKDETTYSIQDAIWYAEATMNFTYTIYDSSFIILSRETSTFSIDLNQDNTINESALLEAYEKMADSLAEHYNNIPSVTKHVVLCDVINAGTSSRILHLSMISVIGYSYTTYQYGTFGPTDYWYAGGLLGNCGDFSGFEGRDATTELEYKLLHPLIPPAENVRVYYTDESTVMEIDPVDYPYANSPRGHRGYIYGSFNPEDEVQCLPPTELNFYISSNGIPYIIDDNDIYSEKEFCLINVYWDFIPGNETYYEQHWFDITYGIKQTTVINPEPLN